MICWGQEGCAWWLWASPSTSGEGAWLARGAHWLPGLSWCLQGRAGREGYSGPIQTTDVLWGSVVSAWSAPSETAATQPSGCLSLREMTW